MQPLVLWASDARKEIRGDSMKPQRNRGTRGQNIRTGRGMFGCRDSGAAGQVKAVPPRAYRLYKGE